MKLKGIPYDASVPDLMQFLSDCVIAGGEEGVEILIGEDGRPSGEALVVLECHEDMVKALNHDRQHIGSRYIEVMFIADEQFQDDMKNQLGTVSFILFDCLFLSSKKFS